MKGNAPDKDHRASIC